MHRQIERSTKLEDAEAQPYELVHGGHYYKLATLALGLETISQILYQRINSQSGYSGQIELRSNSRVAHSGHPAEAGLARLSHLRVDTTEGHMSTIMNANTIIVDIWHLG